MSAQAQIAALTGIPLSVLQGGAGAQKAYLTGSKAPTGVLNPVQRVSFSSQPAWQGAGTAQTNAAGQQTAVIGGNSPAAVAAGVAGSTSGYAGGMTPLAANQGAYQNILSGYQSALAQQKTAQQAVQGGYTQLGNRIQQALQGAETSQKQDIATAYNQQRAKAQQSAINRGLGNTTIVDAMNRGIASDEARANTALAGQFANLRAGYMGQIGQAGLGYAGQAASENARWQGQQLGWQGQDLSQRNTLGQQESQFARNLGYQYAGLGTSQQNLQQQMAMQQQSQYLNAYMQQQQLAQQYALAQQQQYNQYGSLPGFSQLDLSAY